MREMTCIVCPMGCRLQVENDKDGFRVEGNSCRRGEVYAKDEATAPKRVVTSVVAVKDSNRLLPVKTSSPVPKELIFRVMKEIRNVAVNGEVHIGQTLKENLAGTGVALVATKNLPKNGE